MHIVSKPSVALVALAMSLLCACGGRHETTEVYILVTTNTKIPYWQEAAEGLRAAARDLGVKSEMVGPDTYDPKAEKEEILKLPQRKIPPAGVLVSAADPELMREAIDSVAAAGIPVVTIDSDSPKSKRLTFIGTNNYVAGQMSGELLAKELNGKGNVVLFSIPGQANVDERFEGFKRVLSRNPGIKILQVINIAGDPTKAFDGTQSVIEKGKTAPDAFVCLEALSCTEVANVLDRAGMRDKTVIAMDAPEGTLNWMRKGMIRATIAQKPYTMAYYGTRVLDDFHHAKPSGDTSPVQGSRSLVPVFMDTGATLVDKSNMAAFTGAAAPAR
ncbi:MAG TPA: substrate-binding domain-containing protein [Candidatus Solibacter sp.]|nr:substrate-binding domain-containing protein [Candidatus Solibacter sp.]